MWSARCFFTSFGAETRNKVRKCDEFLAVGPPEGQSAGGDGQTAGLFSSILGAFKLV